MTPIFQSTTGSKQVYHNAGIVKNCLCLEGVSDFDPRK